LHEKLSITATHSQSNTVRARPKAWNMEKGYCASNLKIWSETRPNWATKARMLTPFCPSR